MLPSWNKVAGDELMVLGVGGRKELVLLIELNGLGAYGFSGNVV